MIATILILFIDIIFVLIFIYDALIQMFEELYQ